MRLLCLDLARTFGFAFGDVAGVQAHGSFTLPETGTDYGRYLFHYRNWLSSAISRWNPTHIVYESPLLMRHDSIHQLRKTYCLGPRTEEMAQDAGIEVGEAVLDDIRLHFLGTKHAPKGIKNKSARRAWIKDNVVLICRKRGYRPSDDNAADAIALFSYVMSTRNAEWELLGTEIARAA